MNFKTKIPDFGQIINATCLTRINNADKQFQLMTPCDLSSRVDQQVNDYIYLN